MPEVFTCNINHGIVLLYASCDLDHMIGLLLICRVGRKRTYTGIPVYFVHDHLFEVCLLQ